MADYPERTVTAQTNMAEYERAMRIEKLRKKYGNMLWNVSALRGRGWAGSSAAKQWKSAINSSGSSLTGLSTRLKMMKDADKEFVGNQLTSNFQDWLTANPDATIGSFNTWANEQGPWYEAERRARDQKVVKDRYDAMKSTKVAEAVDTLFGEYNDEWITGSYSEQNQVRQNIADSDAIKNLPSKWRASAVDEVIKMLNTLLSPTGQYAAEDQRLQVRAADEATEKHKAALQKTATDKSKDMVANDIVADAAACVLAGGDRETCLQEAKDKQRVTYGNIVEQISEDVRKKFDAESPKPTKRQTKTYYDPDIQDYVLATEEEAEAEGLLPEKVGARLQPQLMSRHNAEDRFWLDAGDELKREGVLSRDIFEFYRRHARRVDDPREQDSEIIRIWKARKKKLEAEAKAAAGIGINLQLLQGGAVTGQTDDGISNVRIKPTNQ